MTRFGNCILMTAAFAAAVVMSAPAMAQRMSLAERVARLEAQAQAGQGNIDLVNQIQALQSQVQQLQGQVEETRHQLDELKERNKQQYIDLDSRLGRFEGNPAAGGGANAPANSGQLDDIQLGTPTDAPVDAPADASAPPRDDTFSEPVIRREPIPSDAPRNDGRDTLASTTSGADPAAAKARYDEAFNALKEGRYAESARRFQSFIESYPTHELTPNAYYWLGESYYVTQNYRVSLDAFQTLLKNYPDSQKAPDALLKTGYCQYELKQWDAAEATLNRVTQKYPDTTVARLAQGRLRALKLEGGR